MNANQIFGILRARWWVVLAVFVATAGATALVTALLPRSYSASTTLVIEPRFTDVLGGSNIGSTLLAQTYMSTQIDIMQSQRVAARVVRDLGIAKNPEAIRQFQEGGGQGSIEDYYAGLLQKKLDVKPSRESSVVTMSFSGSDPRFAAQVADAFAQAYISTALELRTGPARGYVDWFNEQLKTLRADMEGAQTRLSQFQQRNGIVGAEERLDVENARLAELSTQHVTAQAQALDARSRTANAQPMVTSLPDVSMTPVLQSIRADLVRSEAKLEELSSSYGGEHPTYKRQRAEVDGLRERLAQELSNASGTVASQSRTSSQREAELRAAVAVQKGRVLEIKRLRDEMGVLAREADNAQRIYEVALQRMAQSSLESQATQGNASILNRASVPGEPSSPRVKLNMTLSAVLGLLLGIAAAILLELADRRIRSGADLAAAGVQVPVFGQLSARRRRFRLPRIGHVAQPFAALPGASGARA